MLTPELIAQVGFPIAVTMYLLWERGATTKEMIKMLKRVEIAIIKLEGKLEK